MALLRRVAKTRLDVGASDRRFTYFWRRRRLANLPSLMPQDQREMDRLDFQHHLLRQVLRRSYVAPLAQPASILDVGCGTGRWAIEMAEEFPSATIVGIDVLPPSPYGGAPQNCFFQYGNVLEVLPFTDATFDFVHQRCFLDSIPQWAWTQVAQDLARVTRPGGWVELAEFGFSPTVGPALLKLYQWMLDLAAPRGLDLLMGGRLSGLLDGAGLQDLAVREIGLPLGAHGGRIGLLAQTDHLAMLGAFRSLLVGHGMTDWKTFDVTIEKARARAAAVLLAYILLCCAACLLTWSALGPVAARGAHSTGARISSGAESSNWSNGRRPACG